MYFFNVSFGSIYEIIYLAMTRFYKNMDGLYSDHFIYINLFQLVTLSKLYLVIGYPKITWKPDSPFYAVADKNDILEIKTNDDKKVKDIAWFKDGIPIMESKDYNFLGLCNQNLKNIAISEVANLSTNQGVEKTFFLF